MIRMLPEIEPRLESGPVVFGKDWPGLFIRGDDAAHFAMHLRLWLDDAIVDPQMRAISMAVLRGLVSDLVSCDLRTAPPP